MWLKDSRRALLDEAKDQMSQGPHKTTRDLHPLALPLAWPSVEQALPRYH